MSSRWYTRSQAHTLPLSTTEQHWLWKPGSMSSHLSALDTPVSHRLLRQHRQTINPEEARALSLPGTASIGLREIHWHADGVLWVWGRVVLPNALLERHPHWLDHPGSIGRLLFASAKLERSPFTVAKLPAEHPYCVHLHEQHPELQAQALWARQSIFWHHKLPLLVVEIFTPVFFQFVHKTYSTSALDI